MKILVANRGEIAYRIISTLRVMGVPSVAIYSDVDSQAPHVWLADEAVSVGHADGYLNPQKIIDVALLSRATAIHPGYGFLSQNSSFAALCEQAGLLFIGPTPQAMSILGDKRQARLVAQQCGVPVLPGASTCDTLAQAQQAASALTYPLLLKAAGGGGGKGMRLVHALSELPAAFTAAQREAQRAFADARLLLEQWLSPARHIEVQIIGDGTKSMVLGERECSLQRRYQKIIEEAPASCLPESVRQALHAAALKITEAVGYRSLGTVEFLLGSDDAFYFLEVNTRLQVEHPVTELLIGVDLVQLQIEQAHGAALPQNLLARGHAIEARLNAEDPSQVFLPAIGDIAMLRWPHMPFVRIDAGIEEGTKITPHYDPLLAKIIAYGPTRESARRRLLLALEETVCLGVSTNQAFLCQVLQSDMFVSQQTYTNTLETTVWPHLPTPDYLALAASTWPDLTDTSAEAAGLVNQDMYSPWDRCGAFRVEILPCG